MRPSAIRAQPATRNNDIPKKGPRIFQREIHQGTRPATRPGAANRNTADAATARVFLPVTSGSCYEGSLRASDSAITAQLVAEAEIH